MSDMAWEEAVKRVLEKAEEPMHYKSIAEEISAREYRERLGATPANTVNVTIANSLNQLGAASPFERTSRGYYSLRERSVSHADIQIGKSDESADNPSGFIQSLGMYWQSSLVNWKRNPRLLGQQQEGSDPVDFCGQVGVYLLHDRERVIYVGRSVDRPMGQRLFEHTIDRLAGRWDRFSWFGLKSVSQEGELSNIEAGWDDESIIISTLEAVLIEALEPPQNRRRGDNLSVAEYIQAADPERERQKIDAITALISGSLSTRM